MSAILNSLHAHNFLIFQQILMILVSKFMVYRALADKTYLLLGLRSPLRWKLFSLHTSKDTEVRCIISVAYPMKLRFSCKQNII